MTLFASFPLLSEAGAIFVAILATLVLIPSALIVVLRDWIRKERKRRDEPDRR